MKSSKLFRDAQKFLVGGVNSPVRAYKAVGGEPLFISRAKGSKIFDVDGNTYIDYVCSWGANILGSANIRVVKALQETVTKGLSFGAPTELETELATMIKARLPSVDLIRFVNSGTEATMSSLRIARAYTKRDKIIKFEGCYHGHVDFLLAQAGSGLATLGLPSSSGVPSAAARDTIVLPYNDIESVEEAFRKYRKEIAAVIVEPIAGNMGVVAPVPEYLRRLREVTEENSSLLIFDEVITGFRVSMGGAQTLYRVEPDITCLGKIIGGGLPVGAYGGRKEIMELLAPLGPVYQAGTLSGNPLTMTAGIETLRQLKPEVYDRLESLSCKLEEGFKEVASAASVPIQVNRVGSMTGLFFANSRVTNYKEAKLTDTKIYSRFFWKMLEQGIYLPPSAFETIFTSKAHTEADLRKTIDGATQAFLSFKSEGSENR